MSGNRIITYHVISISSHGGKEPCDDFKNVQYKEGFNSQVPECLRKRAAARLLLGTTKYQTQPLLSPS